MAASAKRESETLTADLRDSLTRSRLAGAVANLAGVEVVEFSSDWWDGQAHAPCLVVRGGRRHRLLRVVETGGEAVVVPFDERTAARWIAQRRAPRAPVLGIPGPRAAGDIVVDAAGDVQTCESPTCGALLPIDYDGDCPVCGGDVGVSDEKSTATGARTAGSSTSK
jgi:hypothetical protein